MIDANLRRRFRFFLEHAGYATPPGRAQCALNLARAEMWAEGEDLEFLEQPDDETAFCYCDDPHCKYHEGSDHTWETVCVALVRPCEAHGTECRHAECLASLSGIMEPDRAYLRVVRAELAAEAMHHEG
jgi:hypothetical protein